MQADYYYNWEYTSLTSKLMRALRNDHGLYREAIRFDGAVQQLIEETNTDVDLALPVDSNLKHRAFQILEFEYDLLSLYQNPKSVPNPVPTKLILTRKKQYPFFSVNYVTPPEEGFLMAQKTDPDRWRGVIPKFHRKFVRMGLCFPLLF